MAEKEETDDSKEVKVDDEKQTGKVDDEDQTGNMDLIGPPNKRSYFRSLGIRV